MTLVIGVGLLLFMGPSGRGGARGAAKFAVSAVAFVLLALQGFVLWAYSARLYALRRAPSIAAATEALRWLRYTWIIFMVSEIASDAGKGVIAIAASAAAIPSNDRGDSLAKEAKALRTVVLIGIVMLLGAALVELLKGIPKVSRSPAMHEAVGEIIGALAVELGFAWLSWGFAHALGKVTRAPTLDHLHAAARAYGRIITVSIVLLAVLWVIVVVALAAGETSWLGLK